MALAEVADRSEVRRIERDNHHEIVPLAAGSSNAPRRIQPACIAMQQKRNHHARIERRLAQPTHIAAHDRLEIQTLPHQPNDKPRERGPWARSPAHSAAEAASDRYSRGESACS